MGLTKNKDGSNMYPWVHFMSSSLAGECPHKCIYCYAQDSEKKWKSGRYAGEVRLIEKDLKVKYDKKTLEKMGGVYPAVIFMEHMNDILAKGVSNKMVQKIINHCNEYPENTYVFQTKNPMRFKDFTWTPNAIFGCTIETNRENDLAEAPKREERMQAMKEIVGRKFLTIEPVLKFDVDILAKWVGEINPEFINLGADSKGHNLPEPTVTEIMALVEALKAYGIDLREKHNLQRLMK